VTILSLLLDVAHQFAHALIAPISGTIETIPSMHAIIISAFYRVILRQRTHGALWRLASEGELLAILASHIFQRNSSVFW
jgi:hypothetical protein